MFRPLSLWRVSADRTKNAIYLGDFVRIVHRIQERSAACFAAGVEHIDSVRMSERYKETPCYRYVALQKDQHMLDRINI